MKQLFFTLLLLVCYSISAQTDTTHQSLQDKSDLKDKTEKVGIEPLTYVDHTYGYELVVPKWLNLISTGENGLWGGTFPAVDHIENDVIIQAFNKSRFKSFNHFKEVYITGNTFGQPTLYSKQHIWYGNNEKDIEEISTDQIRAKVYTLFSGAIYHNQFVLIETDKSYLWVQFTSTPTTYDKNIEKFTELVNSIKSL